MPATRSGKHPVGCQCGLHRKPKLTLAERFWAHVQRGPHCWEWTASVNDAGYGMMASANKALNPNPIRAHRLSFELAHGRTLGQDECVCHHCDNPKCVRPSHLFVGSRKDNNADMRAKGRARVPAKLTEAKVRQIKRALARREPQRAIARQFAVSQPTISDIARGSTWSNVA